MRRLAADEMRALGDEERALVKRRFGVLETSTSMYMDHKLPDYLSTVYMALAFGEVYRVGPAGELEWREDKNFVTGCHLFPAKIPAGGNARISNAASASGCPPAFYKTVEYTFEGVPIPKAADAPKHAWDPDNKVKMVLGP